jgi:hypothetical protein
MLIATEDEWTIYQYIQEHPEMRDYLQRNYPDFFDREGKEKDPMDYYREHYSQYFPEENKRPKKIKKENEGDEIVLKHAEGRDDKKSGTYIFGQMKQGRSSHK